MVVTMVVVVVVVEVATLFWGHLEYTFLPPWRNKIKAKWCNALRTPRISLLPSNPLPSPGVVRSGSSRSRAIEPISSSKAHTPQLFSHMGRQSFEVNLLSWRGVSEFNALIPRASPEYTFSIYYVYLSDSDAAGTRIVDSW